MINFVPTGAANMKYLIGLFLLLLSNFTNGQRVLTSFDKVLIADNFEGDSEHWEYRNSGREIFVNGEGHYKMQRPSPDLYSISLLQSDESYAEFEIISKFRFGTIVEKKKLQTGGFILQAEEDGSHALIIEFNNKQEYRIGILANGKQKAMYGSDMPKWTKTKLLEKMDWNLVSLKLSNGIVDMYMNKKFLASFETNNNVSGGLGFFLGPSSSLDIEMFRLAVNSENYTKLKKERETELSPISDDVGVKQMVMIFRNKIAAQNDEIEGIKMQLALCEATKSTDSTLRKDFDKLETDLDLQKQKTANLQLQLDAAIKRQEYLEALKTEIERDPNGDIILSLTDLLQQERQKNQALLDKNNTLQSEIDRLKTD
jgi:hypothetical protein